MLYEPAGEPAAAAVADEGEDATMGIEQWTSGGVAEVVIDFPPVNALPVQGWFDLADAVTAAGADPQVRAVILAAEGRGFCAGVDIKEMQRTPGHEALVGANRGCFAAFAAVYDCAVPVIAAVHGFCLGGGVGLAGYADLVVAAQDATFGLPEVDRGALGAATHLARLVPQQLMRTMVYTCRTVTAQQLLSFGTVLDVVPPPDLRAAARAVAAEIAAKDGGIIRLAKQSLNGIDPVDVKRSYRYEQGFTFELNLTGVSARGPAGVRGRPAVSAAVMRPDAIIGELRSGMTIGIGGWGSRRKPMALVRAILRSDLADLTVVSYGGPDVGLLIAGGHVRRVVTGFVSLDTIPLEPHFRLARQRGSIELTELDEGMLHWGLLAAAHRLPFLPVRAGLGSDVLRVNPDLRTVVSPYGGEELVAMPALRLDAALIHLNRADAAGNGQYLGPDPYFDDLFCLAADAGLPVLRAARPDRGPAGVRAAAEPAGQPGHGGTAWPRPRAARTSPAACPTTAATRPSRPGTRPRPPIRTAGGSSGPSTWTGTRPATRRRCGGSPRTGRTRPSRRRPRERPG